MGLRPWELRIRAPFRMLGPLPNVLLFTFCFSGRAGNVASLHSMTLPSATSSVSRLVVTLGPLRGHGRKGNKSNPVCVCAHRLQRCPVCVHPVCSSLQCCYGGLNFLPPVLQAVMWPEPQSVFLDIFPLLINWRPCLVCERGFSRLSLPGEAALSWSGPWHYEGSPVYLSLHLSRRTENHCARYFSRMFSRPMSVWSNLGNCLCLYFSAPNPHLPSEIFIYHPSVALVQESSSKSKGPGLRSVARSPHPS